MNEDKSNLLSVNEQRNGFWSVEKEEDVRVIGLRPCESGGIGI